MFRYLKPALLILPYAIGCYFRWIFKYAKHPEKKPIEYRYQKVTKLIKKLNRAMDVELIVVGNENIPDGVNYFVSNHLGAYDPVLIINEVNKPTSVVAKIEIHKYPFAGKLIKTIEGVFLDRKDIKQSLSQMIKVRDDLASKNKSWLIFPEGTRNKDEHRLLRPFHPGSLNPAMKTNTPIVPVVVYGSQRVTDSSNHLKKYPVYLEFCKPIVPSDYPDLNSQEFANMIRDIIQQKLTYNARKIDHEQMVKINSKKYKM